MSPYEEVMEKVKTSEDAQHTRPRVPHSKEAKKKQKREWIKRRKEEKRKEKRDQKKARGKQGAPHCFSETVAVPEVVLPPDTIIKKRKTDIVDDVAGSELVLAQGTGTQGEEKQGDTGKIAYVDARPIPPATQATRETAFSANVESLETLSRGQKFVTLSKLKRQRADISNQNPPVFKKPSAAVRVGLDRNVAQLKPVSRGKKVVTVSKLKRKRPEVQSNNNPRVFTKPSAAVRVEHDKKVAPMKPVTLREINTSLLVKTSDKPIGSGTFGQVFLAEYRGMKAVVKEMKRRNESKKETERCKHEVLHEARVLVNLGDHPNLPFLFGICTEKEPFSLVIQFYGKGEKSLTLHKFVVDRILRQQSTAKVFQDIVNTLKYIHKKGYIHNDLKSNNVIMHRRGDEFHPIIIDFGKSKEILKVEGYKRRAASYIAPEVILGDKESPASDMYSFGKMLEAAVSCRSFCSSFEKIISDTTALSASDRPSACKVSLLLESLTGPIGTTKYEVEDEVSLYC